MHLGTVASHDQLTYDTALYEFRIAGSVCTYAEVRELDDHAHIAWNAPEQRDWFRKINPADLAACNRRALERRGLNVYEGMTAEQRVEADAKRDDSVLAGKIVDADPALVRAVVDQLEAQGLVGHASHAHATTAAEYAMPQGMEPLAQLQRQEGRKMTLMEHYLMRQILKNDDKEKVKREKQAAQLEQEELKEEQHDAKVLKRKNAISAAQKRMERREASTEANMRQRSAHMQVEKQKPQQGMDINQALAMAETGASARLHVTTDAMNVVAGAASGPVRYTDSYGNPIRPEADAMRPSMSQSPMAVSAEEAALTQMRARNLAEQSRYQTQSADVPGMEASGGRRMSRNEGASINGHAVNADGTPKETGFTKFVDGLGKVSKAVSPLMGGPGGGGHGGGMGGGGMAGGGMSGGMGGGMSGGMGGR